MKEEDLEYLYFLENCFSNTKDETSKHKKKESRKHKKSKLLSEEPLDSPKVVNVGPLSDSAFKSCSSSKKKRSQPENFLQLEDIQSNKKGKTPDPSSIKVKKMKRENHEVHFESSGSPLLFRDTDNVNLLTDSSVKSSLSKKNKRAALKVLENILQQENGQSEKMCKIMDSSVKVKKEKHKKKREVHFESEPHNSYLPVKQPTSEKQSSRKKLKRQQQEELPSSLLSSPDNLPEVFLEDKTGVSGNVEDTDAVSDHSLDLFITQKQFLTSELLSCSGDSPPLGQKRQESQNVKQKRSPNSSCGIQSLSRSLPKIEDDSCEMQDFGANSKNKSTQTDNLFTYLSLMTFLKKVKVVEACSEKPLDLCLPSRTRAVNSCSGHVNDNDVILIGSSPTATAPGKATGRPIILSPPQPFDHSKFVQTILNSSYYFKGKGEMGECNPLPPLLKMKQTPKKSKRRH